MTEWQDISTAPKNAEGEPYGPPVLVWVKNSHTIHHAMWGAYEINGQLQFGWVKYRTFRQGLEPVPNSHTITHWMPLPPPPTDLAAGIDA